MVGSAAIIMADIGRHSVIGAGAVVTKPAPDRHRRRRASARDPQPPA
jgi:acetyltransferase-like isoleucine patch superfamily enzyme